MGRTVLITGAAGNLGGFLARHLMDSDLRLRLMIHFVRIGMVPYVMDTSSMRRELLAELVYPTFQQGIVEM